jgi:MFS family permease
MLERGCKDGFMPVIDSLGRAAAATGHGTATASRRTVACGRWLGRKVGRVRSRIAGGETGMIRLFDLHAIAAAGDTLIALGLAGTIFFNVPLGEARGNVALYLLVTMVPFAVLAPLIGPLLDHVRHGRRWALAATMLGRAFLAWLIADYLDNVALYPAAFGILVLSRAYGVARAAAVPRLLPERLGLSQVNSRGSVYGTLAAMVVLPLGLAAFWFGAQWPLRVASAIFLAGMVVALRLPAQADSDPAAPEAAPRLFRHAVPLRNGGRDRVLSGRLVTATLVGGVVHRALYGFLLIFLAFSIRSAGGLPSSFFGLDLGEGTTLGLVSGCLVIGTFLAVAAGSRLRIRRPILIQATGLLVAAVIAVAATVWYALPMVMLLCLAAAISSGLAKIALDSSIQEKLDEKVRATAFAHSETLLMLAFVAGSAVGLIPMPGRLGVGIAAGLLVLAVVRATVVSFALRADRLSGRPAQAPPPEPDPTPPPEPEPAPAPATELARRVDDGAGR